MKNVRALRLALPLMLLCVRVFADRGSPDTQPRGAWPREPDFWIATAANVAGVGLFMARVHAASAAPILGCVTQALGIPALVVGITDLATGTADVTTVGVLVYAAWSAGSALLDHVLKVSYRDPVRPGILIPYVACYYAGIGLMSASQLVHGVAPWVIAGCSCLLAVGASFYARAKGAD